MSGVRFHFVNQAHANIIVFSSPSILLIPRRIFLDGVETKVICWRQFVSKNDPTCTNTYVGTQGGLPASVDAIEIEARGRRYFVERQLDVKVDDTAIAVATFFNTLLDVESKSEEFRPGNTISVSSSIMNLTNLSSYSDMPGRISADGSYLTFISDKIIQPRLILQVNDQHIFGHLPMRLAISELDCENYRAHTLSLSNEGFNSTQRELLLLTEVDLVRISLQPRFEGFQSGSRNVGLEHK